MVLIDFIFLFYIKVVNEFKVLKLSISTSSKVSYSYLACLFYTFNSFIMSIIGSKTADISFRSLWA